MKRWTLIAEYEGGTYIRQVMARSLKLALDAVCASDELDFWIGLLDQDLFDPVPITGTGNVWCVSGLFNDKSVRSHIVLTAQN